LGPDRYFFAAKFKKHRGREKEGRAEEGTEEEGGDLFFWNILRGIFFLRNLKDLKGKKGREGREVSSFSSSVPLSSERFRFGSHFLGYPDRGTCLLRI
jgi:hypothetical protein